MSKELEDSVLIISDTSMDDIGDTSLCVITKTPNKPRSQLLQVPLLESPCLDESTEEGLLVTQTLISVQCPVTRAVMKHPMRNKICGHRYDKPGVDLLMANRRTKAKCPVQGCDNMKPLALCDLEEDEQIKEYILSHQLLSPKKPEKESTSVSLQYEKGSIGRQEFEPADVCGIEPEWITHMKISKERDAGYGAGSSGGQDLIPYLCHICFVPVCSSFNGSYLHYIGERHQTLMKQAPSAQSLRY